MPERLFTGKNLIELPEVSSTNNFAAGLLRDNPPEGTVILAWDQSSGRGQQGNTWISPPGKNLTVSIIYYPSALFADRMFQLSKAVSLAVRETVENFLPLADVQVKWPNDILLNQKKVAGILIENQLEGTRIKNSVIGIGLNVKQMDFPPSILHSATSIIQHLKSNINLDQVLEVLLDKLESWYLLLQEQRHELINRSYLSNLYGYQSEVRISMNGQEYFASVAGIDTGGKIAIEYENRLHYFNFKEITFII